MTTSRAFDLAEWVGVPAHPGDGVTVDSMGPPFVASFKPLVTSPTPGTSLGQSIPNPTGANQILVSGSGAGFPWGLTVNPAVGATVPKPSAQYHILMADATPSWQEATIAQLLSQGNAVVTNGAATYTFDTSSVIAFTASATLTTRVNGGDPTKSALDNFSIDCGTF